MAITATYSPEDNKLRLYPSARLDAETFQRVKDAGYKWAPRQELFVAPKWTPACEDLAVELAGEIEAEEMTVAERAEMKADRLDGLADKRTREANQFQKAARDISERFAQGQPILVGHHSERKARKDQERMHAAASKASKAAQAVDYWNYRARGVEHFANMKNDPRTRARRIKTLFAELRDWQRRLNDAHKALDLWHRNDTPEQIKALANYSTLSLAPFGLWSDLDKGAKDAMEARAEMIAALERRIESPNLARWITHTLNRIGFEQDMLGGVARYAGEITPTLLQMFVREHGGDKPKGQKIEDGFFAVQCEAPFPAHIARGDYAEMSGEDWRDLMQACGYVPAEKAPAKPPILNFVAPCAEIAVKSRATYRGAETIEMLPQRHMTKADFGKIDTDYKGTRLSACGTFRARVTLDPAHTGPRYQAGWAVIYIADQKAHDMPASVKEAENA